MSVLLRTISAFPSGRTTSELFALLDVDFDPRKRTELYAELSLLTEAGKITKSRDGKWRPLSRYSTPQTNVSPAAGPQLVGESKVLRAAHASFRTSAQREPSLDEETGSVHLDPSALLRYYRSTLRADPRGAISQVDDRHGVQWHLVTGAGPLTPEEGQNLHIAIALNDLSDEFRKALVKREANEQTLAVGWPIAVGRKQGAPVAWPIGLISAEWTRSETHLEIMVDADDVLVNPDWLKGAARGAGWTEASLRDVFNQTEGLGLERADFLTRLKEAVAGAFRGKVSGTAMLSEIDPETPGIYDLAALFLPTDTTFTAGAVRDLDQIGAWASERLSRTALASILGLDPKVQTEGPAAINAGSLNKEQIMAVRSGMNAPLTVITGPPGTGKSQTIVSMVASVLAQNGSVLVASKNHQALDAVENRLAKIAPGSNFLVRTLDPTREIDQSFTNVLAALIREPSKAAIEPDRVMRSRLATLAQQRARVLDQIDEHGRLNAQIAEFLDRIEARQVQGDDRDVRASAPAHRGFWSRILKALLSLFSRKRNDAPAPNAFEEGASLATLQTKLEHLRAELDALDKAGDPIGLTAEIATTVGQLLPRVLASRVALSEADRSRLGEEHANLELAQTSGPLPIALAAEVIAHRPLWLASVLGAPRRVPLGEGLFDLVIFDEASQCDIASALPLFARAKRAVVVGDDRQLSFISQLGIAHDRNLMQAQGLPVGMMGRLAQSRRSLFDLANLTPGATKVTLRDQYRSATDIVGYINEQFYGGRLRVAADQDRLKVPNGAKPGIEWTDVPAPSLPMQGNVNSAEVAAIVAQLRLLLEVQEYSGTVGVIAPFRPQVQALNDAIKGTMSADLLDQADFRAGTVDSFQGQERDLILFSPCLGRSSATSAVTFVQKDWRRLNVAISRARAVAHIFGDLSYARSGKVTSLQKLASMATEPRPRVAEDTFDSEWERRVYFELRDRGFDPIAQYEVAGRRLDFALFGSGNIKLDLEIDGRHWHSDSDGKRKLSDHWRDHQLRGLGWRVRRFWVDELARDMEGCLELIRKDLS
ncbi:AAA domain-containing protein [Rhizobium ruizarguesonis]|uniref:AAA domain-containing protein n=1 Tax=Rhizobium ruizarguesonis TaxID=2081791 RepID=UPI0013C10DB4|nr:AAA domain-containing protein [Rhizobium ruizarguesonis]NEJ00160.1 AAA family ATPase [Rhizobium ruizarguesonis]NEJ37650.1 AAA family ATPase [Rhizobium ruizarguesonis]